MVYPIALVEINGIKTHALLDTRARRSYASTKLVNALNKKPKEVKTKRIEIMLTSSTTRVKTYSANIKSMDGKFNMNIELSKVDKAELMSVKNPQYKLLEKYNHLKGAKLEDRNTRPEIPIHVVMGTSDYAMVKNTTAQKVGLLGQLIAERTLLKCTVMSPGSDEVDSSVLLTKSPAWTINDCALDVLGLADNNENGQKTQCTRNSRSSCAEMKLDGILPCLPTKLRVSVV